MVRVYFTAADGTTYRVYDAQLVAGRYYDLGPCALNAVYRVFITEERKKLAYAFKRDEARTIRNHDLERQIGVAREKRQLLLAEQRARDARRADASSHGLPGKSTSGPARYERREWEKERGRC
jgi:hypothetical protein